MSIKESLPRKARSKTQQKWWVQPSVASQHAGEKIFHVASPKPQEIWKNWGDIYADATHVQIERVWGLRSSGTQEYVAYNLASTFNQISEKVDNIARQVAMIKEQLEVISESSQAMVYSYPLTELSDDALKLGKPLTLIIEEGDGVIAKWPETTFYGFGSTAAEAILAIKKNIVDEYRFILSLDSEQLGEIAIYTKEIIESYLQK